LLAASKSLKYAKIYCNDFTVALKKTEKNDFVYLDPPYVTGHKNNGFIEYNSLIFSWDKQKKLSELVFGLIKRGCKVLVSNADHKEIRKLYCDWNIRKINRNSTIAANLERRNAISELLISG
jgi:DNA adenine methylase